MKEGNIERERGEKESVRDGDGERAGGQDR